VESLSVIVAGACRKPAAGEQPHVGGVDGQHPVFGGTPDPARRQQRARRADASSHVPGERVERPGELHVDIAHELVVAAERIGRDLQAGDGMRTADPVEARRESPEPCALEYETVRHHRATRLERVQVAAHRQVAGHDAIELTPDRRRIALQAAESEGKRVEPDQAVGGELEGHLTALGCLPADRPAPAQVHAADVGSQRVDAQHAVRGPRCQPRRIHRHAANAAPVEQEPQLALGRARGVEGARSR
jgi:hypothetical protein